MCERLIEHLTKNTKYAYSHKGGFQEDCWLQDCTESCGDCSDTVHGSKLKAVLQDGPLPSVLKLHPAKCCVTEFSGSLYGALAWCRENVNQWVSVSKPASLTCDKPVLLQHDVALYYVRCVGSNLEISVVQNGHLHYIPRGLSYEDLLYLDTVAI